MPSGGSTPVDVIGMGQARTQFENTASTFTRQLGQVDHEVDSLRSTWTGGASVEFDSAIDDWGSDLAIVIEELRAVVQAMGGGAGPRSSSPER